MRRRHVLQTLSVAAAAIAGCTSGPRKSGPKWGPPETEPDEPTQDYSTRTPTTTTATTTAVSYGFETSFTYRTGTEDDAFYVTVTVSNTADVERTGRLVVTWGDDDETRERLVSLAPGEATTFELKFPEFGNLAFDWEEP